MKLFNNFILFSQNILDCKYPTEDNTSSCTVKMTKRPYLHCSIFLSLHFSDFFIFGESYGGKYIPDLAYGIHKGNFQPRLKSQKNIQINLKGIGIGNGWMSPMDQGKYASFLYYHGMLDGEQYLTLLQLEEELISMVIIQQIKFYFCSCQ